MNTVTLRLFVTLVIISFGTFPASGAGQSAGTDSEEVPDLSGLWAGSGTTRDIVSFMSAQGQQVPFPSYGADRYGNVDLAQNPNGYCLPPGPSRAITGPSPFMIVQTPTVVALLHENHGVYRPIYLDGRGHPEDINIRPPFMGHSTGQWEEDALVVEAVALHERTWLDSFGLEHSNELRLVERFQKTGPDVIRYSVTYEDPVFFTRPWTLTTDLERLTDTRLIEYVCNENERDRERLQPTFPRRP